MQFGVKFHKQHSSSDEELLADYKKSLTINVLGVLYERYMALVYGLSLKYLRDKEAAKDAVMQIFEKLVEKLPNQEVRNFKSWLYVVAKNHCLMQLRKNKQTKQVVFDERFMDFEDNFHLQKAMDDERIKSRLDNCIEQLPPHQRAAIRQFYLEELSYKEISLLMTDDIKKIKSFIQNGKRNLKICLEKDVKL
ncbi:MAG: RNA polymerase sigma factor [Prevotellaceae bacterium]|jgi:RNA polymerase sigma-70 factor (ECF subfamily)|nr:RNA polymerase sigma factor [Prevotellaceae bacterium]